LYHENIDILNSDSSQKLTSLIRLRSMKDKRVIEPFLKIFEEDKDDYMRSSALFRLVELNNHNIFPKIKLKQLLEMALDDQSQAIRDKAKESLEELKK
jgi:HEAT repeat protein